MSAEAGEETPKHRLTWQEGLFLVGPDPLTSPYYSSGALILAGVGYTTPLFQVGLYLLLFLLAPLYIEAVLLTLSNGGAYVMTRYALDRFGRLAVGAAAVIGVVISFSYVATTVVSMLAYSDYVSSLGVGVPVAYRTLVAILLSAVPSLAFGVWVMPREWRRVLVTVGATSLVALVLSSAMTRGAVVMLAPLVMLFTLNNRGLRESVLVSKTIFLINGVVMVVLIGVGVVYLIMYGADFSVFVHGATLDHPVAPRAGHEDAGMVSKLPGFMTIVPPLILAGTGASVLGASGVESVMNIPEELARPRRDIPKIYMWMLGTLLLLGGSLSFLLFLVLPPDDLASKSDYLLAALGHHALEGVTGSATLANVFQTIIVANAALLLIGAANTSFAGARGLWLTMARDNLLPRFMLTPNALGAFDRLHWLMLISVFLLGIEAEWQLPKLGRWYGATFGLVMVAGMVGFILLRKFKADDRRVYWAPLNVTVAGVRVPITALLGLLVLGYALLSMWSSYRGDFGELRILVMTVSLLVVGILLLYNHRPLLRDGHAYVQRVLSTVESTAIETADRTIVVAVGSVRAGRLLQKAIALARRQSRTTGIPYRQMVVLHMTPTVKTEHVYEVAQDSVRPPGIAGNAVRIFTQLTELAPADMRVYLALVPPADPGDPDDLHAALEALVEFHDRHGFKGHMVMVGTYALKPEILDQLQERLEGSTLVPVPLFGEE